MEKIDDGGNAFPNWGTGDFTIKGGMTLRQWYTGKALQGIIAQGSGVNSNFFEADVVARMAFRYANALIEEEQKHRAPATGKEEK